MFNLLTCTVIEIQLLKMNLAPFYYHDMAASKTKDIFPLKTFKNIFKFYTMSAGFNEFGFNESSRFNVFGLKYFFTS